MISHTWTTAEEFDVAFECKDGAPVIVEVYRGAALIGKASKQDGRWIVSGKLAGSWAHTLAMIEAEIAGVHG